MQVALDLGSIENLPSRRPLLVFNLVDTINCDGRFAPLVPSRLDALGIAYTGCRTNALFETLSKVGTKLRLAHADLPTPEWSTDGTGFKRDTRVIVKASWEHGSLGIDQMSVTRGADAQRTIAARTWRLKTEHFAEAYIEGREFHLALLERISGVEVLPIAEIVFGGFKAQAPKIFGYDAKWTPDSSVYIGTLRRFGLDQDEPQLAETLKRLALACWTLFRFSGYARVDFRVEFDRRALHHRRKPKPVSNTGYGRRCRRSRGGTLLQGLDRRHCREFAWSFETACPTCFATEDRLAPSEELRSKEDCSSACQQWRPK